MISDIQHCRDMVAREERRALEAPTPEAAESHRQMAMLYTAQCRLLQGRLGHRQFAGFNSPAYEGFSDAGAEQGG